MARRHDLRSTFRRRLKEARARLKLSQRDLGIKAGLDQFVASTRINRYEQGIHEPDLATIERLARAVDVPTPYLFADDDQLARWIIAFSALDPNGREELLKRVQDAAADRPAVYG